MKDLKRTLQLLDDLDLHVHVISDNEELPIPIQTIVMSTHYVMREDSIVHVGNPGSIEVYVNRAAADAKIKCALPVKDY